jgi:uncharacterized membrane protein
VPTVEVATTVRLPRPEVFDFLLDFTGYADYSKYLRSVEQSGDGGVGTEYRLRFEWWKLAYTVRSRVTAVERPERIEWETAGGIDAHGCWEIASASVDGCEQRSRTRFVATYDPGSVDQSTLDLPALVPFDRIVDRVVGLIEAEGRRVVERVVADLEGEHREVDLDVTVR